MTATLWPELVTHHLASAPSIWWADRAILKQAADLRAA